MGNKDLQTKYSNYFKQHDSPVDKPKINIFSNKANQDDKNGDWFYVKVDENTILNFRDRPDSNGHVIDTIAPCEEIEALDIENNEWYKVRYHNKIGYCMKAYLKIIF